MQLRSNFELAVLSKLVEKVISRQLNSHLDMNTLGDPFQTAYRHGHSTETALLRVKNDIAVTLDEKGKVVLVMLDLSSAFDIINHNIDESTATFCRHYRRSTFMAPFVHHRTLPESRRGQRNICWFVMKCGVPQGSVLGPILYCIYTIPIGEIVAQHGLKYHCYADDTQIYMAVKNNQPITEAITKIEQCICTGYRFVCARHIKCLYLLIRLCMTKHRVTSRNYNYVVNPIADWGIRLCRYRHYLLRRRFCRSSSRSMEWTAGQS